MSVLQILNEIAATSSTLAKEAIVRREAKNMDLKAVFAAAYNPMITYNIRQIPDYVAGKCSPQLSITQAIDALSDLSTRKVTGNAASNTLGWILTNCSVEDARVIEMIIARDLRCGCSDTIASKIWPGLVPSFDVMLSHKDISGIKFPAYAQLKMDGMRCHLVFDGVHATAWSRAGKEIELRGALDETARKYMKAGETWDGELIGVRNGKVMSRKEGNGLANKGVKGTISVEEANLMHFATWDIVDFTSTYSNQDRFEALTSRFLSPLNDEEIDSHFRLVDCKIVNSEQEAQEIFEQVLAADEEGLILKNLKGVWVPKRTKDLGKMKAEEEADLRVIGWYPGREGTKYEFGIGGLVCTTEDGLLEVNVGGGFSDEQRFEDPANWVGSVVTVMYNMRIKSKGDKKESLFLPRLIEKRLDKNVANTLAELK